MGFFFAVKFFVNFKDPPPQTKDATGFLSIEAMLAYEHNSKTSFNFKDLG